MLDLKGVADHFAAHLPALRRRFSRHQLIGSSMGGEPRMEIPPQSPRRTIPLSLSRNSKIRATLENLKCPNRKKISIPLSTNTDVGF
jgi:hypothetical protein